MSTIYLILGIVGWTAVAIVLPVYVAKGKPTPSAVQSDPNDPHTGPAS